jgi:hypothetical protein
MPLTIPRTFATAGAGTPGLWLDDDYNAILAWINARNPTVGPIASRPAAGNVGALYVASDQNNAVYVDDGVAWQLTGVLVGTLPGAAGFTFAEIATPTTPAANKGVLYLLTTAASERLTWLDATGTVATVPGLLLRGGNTLVVNTAVETTLFSQTIKAGLLNETGRTLVLAGNGAYLNNSGAGQAVTFRVKFAGLTVLTLSTGSVTSGAVQRGVDLGARFGTAAGGATASWAATGRLVLGGPGIGGTSVGEAVRDASYANSGALGTVSLIADQVLALTVQLGAANPSLQIYVNDYQVELK